MAPTTSKSIEWSDLERLRRAESPELSAALLAFVAQPDDAVEKPQGPTPALDLTQVLQLVRLGGVKHARGAVVEAGLQAWPKFLAQSGDLLPERLRVADLLVALYADGTDASRTAVFEVARAAPLRAGVWGGLKRIYKLAEQAHDAAMFGVLAWRCDVTSTAPEVSPQTLLYMRRRAWRYLRELGRATPELYPLFAVEVLRHYESTTNFSGLWVCHHLWGHQTKHYTHRNFWLSSPPTDLVKQRAYPEAWKKSPDPLMRLLETAQHDHAARFAIECLRADFPEVLRSVTPAWLDRLARRPLASAHDFLVETLQASPDFHQGKLRALGLHEAVLSLLVSPSAKARTYAIEYARAHAPDLSSERLADLVECPHADTQSFAANALQSRPPKALGLVLLGRLLASKPTQPFAAKALLESFDRAEVSETFLADLFFGKDPQRKFAQDYLAAKYQPNELPAAFWIKVLDDSRMRPPANPGAARTDALNQLGKYSYAAIGATWLLEAVTRPELASTLSGWLRKAESLPGLDVERVKSLVFLPQHRELALHLLGNAKLVKPRDLSLGWLLALARRADPVLHEFAHRFLLQNMAPADFAESGNAEAGLERLFQLALGAKEPEPVRSFAQTYLRCHHPVIGPEQAEAKAMQLKPQVAREAYTAARIWPALRDARDDVRRFAVALTRAELRRWGYQTRVYELAEAEAKEVRHLAYDALLEAGQPTADAAFTLHVKELDPLAVFGMTESRQRATRQIAVELIRRHYAHLGGAQRLGWLMESADREVRLFAVRLLWEKHRPRATPATWKPSGPALLAPDAGRFADTGALRTFLRRTLYGVPPGRSKEAAEGATPVRRLSASEAKRNVIEVVRDLGLESAEFAQSVAPVLGEFTGSLAKAEWQACLAALVALRAAHPQHGLGGF